MESWSSTCAGHPSPACSCSRAQEQSLPAPLPFPSPLGSLPQPCWPSTSSCRGRARVGLQFPSSAALGAWSSRMGSPASLQALLCRTPGTLLSPVITTKPGAEPCLGVNTAEGQARKQGSENKEFLICVFHRTALLHCSKSTVGDPTAVICCGDCYVQ